jgi:hypothetical protein
MERVTQGLKVLGWVLGGIVIVYGVARFVAAGAVPALLIALAVMIVGPLEDLLKAAVRRQAAPPEQKERLVQLMDQATSAAFLILLILAIYRG